MDDLVFQSRRPIRRRAVAFVLSITTGLSVAMGVPAYAAEPEPAKLPKASPGRAITGAKPTSYRFTAPRDDARTAYRPDATTWPAAGSVSLDLKPASVARAQGSPVWMRPVTGHDSARAEIRVLDRTATARADVAGVLLAVTPADGASGRTRIGLDYAGFAEAYGGNYGSRLRLVQLPACALTTPRAVGCRSRTPLASTNDRAAKEVSAEVALSAAPTVLAAVSDPGTEGGDAGTYAASDLKPSGSWSGGGSTGSFSYSYPITLPQAPGGLAPSTGLSYDSSSVDGQTASTQAQASWVGDGWGTPQSYIEQTFSTCNDKPQGKEAPEDTYDLCYAGPIMTLSLNGSTSRLVWDSGNQEWRPENDNGEVIRLSVGFDNGSGAENTNYWTVTTRDGTKYQFGRNRLPGWVSGSTTTNSVDTVPVYSAFNGDPCFKSSGFKDSYCDMARRWNLDYVTDVNGNAMSYYYAQDKNFYGRHKADAMAEYVRDSHPVRIDYGFRDGQAYGTVPNQVVFTTGPRCVATSCSPLSDSTKANWPDVPYDLVCKKDAECETWSPSYFSTVRLASIITQQYDITAKKHLPIDTYALTQTLPATGDGTSPTLWLSSIRRTGEDFGVAGSATVPDVTLPPVVFSSIKLANRVPTDGYPSFNRHRIESVTTESGSVITASYERPKPCTSTSGLAPATNTNSCYPVQWTPDGSTEPMLDWFNKYAVTRVTQTDPTGGAAATSTSYEYLGGAAWHYDDNEIVKAKYRTYGQFRGYGKVQTFTGDGVNDKRTKSESTFYRGMSKNNNTTVVNVTDSLNGEHEDRDELAGQVLETIAYQGEGGAADNSTITSYWVSAATATRTRTGLPALTSNWVAPALTLAKQRVVGSSGTTWRYHETDNSYDASVSSPTIGVLKHVYSHTVPAESKYDRCVSNTYAPSNAVNNLVGLVTETETVAVPCAGFTQREIPSVPFSFNALSAPTSVSRPDQVVTKSRMYYDDHNWSDAFPQSAAPAKGLVTMVKQAADYSGGAYTYQTTKRNHYDKYGRVDDTYDGKGSVTHTAFTENTTGLTTGVQVSNAAGHSTSTTVSPRRGLTLSNSDINDVKTTVQYDALGRTTSVWLNDRAVTTPANFKFGYTISNTGVSGTTTDRLTESLGYTRATTINDALLRPRQTQTMTIQGGRLVTDTFYDTRGWVSATYDGWWDPGTTPAIGAPVSVHDLKLKAPSQTFLRYDGLGRVAVTERAKDGVTVSKSISVYGGDRTTTVPPTGGTVTTTVADPIGRTTALQEYTARPVVTTPADIFTGTFTATGGTALTTTYSYDAQGNQNKVTDTKQNNWVSQYNLLGQTTNRKDPDAGEVKDFRYDRNGNLLQSTDGRGKTTSFTYDDINRKTGSFAATVENQATANQLSSIVYDNTNNAVAGMTYPKGHVTTSIAYAGGQSYKTQVTGFTVFGSSKGEKVTIPGTDALSGDWNFSRTYNPNTGLLFKDTYPARGGLPSETVINTYDRFDQPYALAGLNPYLQAVTYDAYSRISQTVLGSSTNQAWVTNTWDEHNGRLKQRLVSRKPTTPANVDQQDYEYDLAGNLTKQISQRPAVNNIGETQCFTYDQLRRLTEAWTATNNCATAPTATSRAMVGNTIGGASAYWTSWSFDDLGNRTSQIQRSLAGGADTTIAYKYDENGGKQPHTLTSTSTTGGSTSSTSYKYDTAGNMTTRNAANGNQTLTWDDAGKLGSVSNASGTSTSVYNVDGSLLLQREAGSVTLYLAGQQHVLNTSTGLVAGTRYYGLPGTGAAIRTGTSTNFSFAISDMHGTPGLYLNNTAQTPSWRLFTPYGAPRGATISIPDNRGFLNKPENKTTGLTNVGAREYDPAVGRFISVDPIQDLADPQQWNGYAYAGNNPTSFSDPSGLIAKQPNEGNGGGSAPAPAPSNGGNPGNSKPECDINCVLDSPAPDNGTDRARVSQGYDGTEAYTYRDAVEFASQSHAGYKLVCIHTFGYSEEACDSSDPWSKPKPGQPRWDDLKILGGLIVVGALIGVGIACVETVAACGAMAADGALGEAAYGSAVLGTPGGAAAMGGLAAGGRWLKGFMGVEKSSVKMSPAAEKLLLGKCSFTPDTEVLMADGSTKPIKDVKVGDKVLAADPETGKTATKAVTALHNHLDSDLVDVDVVDKDGVRQRIHATGNHPFWNVTTRAWIRADELRGGDRLRSDNGITIPVAAVLPVAGDQRMLNLTVADIHTYYVVAGNTPVLVHNCGGLSEGYRSSPGLRGDPYHPDEVAKRSAQNSELYRLPVQDRAAALGYKSRIPAQRAPFNSHGQVVFSDGKNYITPDVDGHNVSDGWKMFNRRGQRIGTYDADLNYLKE